MYPPTPPRLPSLELPVRQFEDLQVRSVATSPDNATLSPGNQLTHLENLTEDPESISQPVNIAITIPGTLSPIPELDESGPPLTDMDTQDDEQLMALTQVPGGTQVDEAHDTEPANLTQGMPPSPSSESTMLSLPSLETPPTSPEPSVMHVLPDSDPIWKPNEGWTADDWPTDAWDSWGVLAPDKEPTGPSRNASIYDDEPWYINGHPARTYPQQTSASEMRRTISRLTSHLLPLTAVRFGSRMSYRTIGRLREAIPRLTFQRLFVKIQKSDQTRD